MFNKKGQAALEFLTTYGWAFLVILVMIGALAYFGVLNPERFVPERCKLSGELECNTFSLTETDFSISLKNNLNQEINVTGVRIQDPTDPAKHSDLILNQSGTMVSGGKSLKIASSGGHTTTHNLSLSSGDKVRYNLEISWYLSDYSANFTRTSTGDIVATVSN